MQAISLQDIRMRTAYAPNAPQTQKAALRSWLLGRRSQFPLALTLTLKQSVFVSTDRGRYKRALTLTDCEGITRRFIQKLNREVFGKRGADKYMLTLNYLPVIEGGGYSSKNLHLHFALGGLPHHIRFNQVDRLVTNAKVQVEGIDAEHKVDLADSGWLDYLTKEVSTRHTDSVLWTLAVA